jgi:hypothetical protein
MGPVARLRALRPADSIVCPRDDHCQALFVEGDGDRVNPNYLS